MSEFAGEQADEAKQSSRNAAGLGSCDGDRRIVVLLLVEATFLMGQRSWLNAIRRLARAWELARAVGDAALLSRTCLKLSEAYGECGLDYLAQRFLQHAITAEMETWRGECPAGEAIDKALRQMKQAARDRQAKPLRVFDPEWN